MQMFDDVEDDCSAATMQEYHESRSQEAFHLSSPQRQKVGQKLVHAQVNSTKPADNAG